jgi:hypothetical protein
VPTGKKPPDGTPVLVTVTDAEQLSSLLGVPNSVSPTTKPHEPDVPGGVAMFTSGGAVMVGGVLSLVVTVIVCVQLAVRPSESVAVQVMVVMPPGYGASIASPSLRVDVTVTPLPVVVGVPTSTVASQAPLAA